MFEDSTKAIIISSSHIKGVGPRIGSVGYAVPIRVNTSVFLPHQTQFINGFVLFALRMVFIRYGYGKERPKYEVKKLLGAIPIVNELRKNSETERIVRTSVEKLPKNDFNGHSWLKAKLDLFGKTDNINVCIVAPTRNNSFDLRTCSNLEFEAWFVSLMLQEHVRLSIKKIINNKIYLNKLPVEGANYIGNHLRFYFRTRKNQGAFIDYILEEKGRREDLIKFVRTLKTIYLRRSLVQHTKSISRILNNPGIIYRRGSMNMGSLLCKLTNHMFTDGVINWKLDVLNKAKVVKNKDSITAKIRKTKEVLEHMASEISNK